VAAYVTAPAVNNYMQLQLLNMAAAIASSKYSEVDCEKQPTATSSSTTHQEQQNVNGRTASTTSQGRPMVIIYEICYHKALTNETLPFLLTEVKLSLFLQPMQAYCHGHVY
jgi:hypothetical protein